MKKITLIFASILIIGSFSMNIMSIYKINSMNTEIEMYKNAISINKNIDENNLNIELNVNFKQIFLQKNDSIYQRVWNNAFENMPEEAFLISCSYYYTTKNNNAFKDMQMSMEQIKAIYCNISLVNSKL